MFVVKLSKSKSRIFVGREKERSWFDVVEVVVVVVVVVVVAEANILIER